MIIPENTYILINGVICAFFILSILNGMRKGLVLQIVDLVGLVFALWVAYNYAPALAITIPIFPVDAAANVIEILSNKFLNIGVWFLLLVIGIKLVLLIFRPLISIITKLPIISSLNKFFGGLFGAIVGLIWLFVALNIIRLPYFENGEEVIEETLFKTINELTFTASDYLLVSITNSEEVQTFFMEYIDELESDIEYDALFKWFMDIQVNGDGNE
ncbi:MAG: CvpA family protein [Erysipelotrichaceae bacterium]